MRRTLTAKPHFDGIANGWSKMERNAFPIALLQVLFDVRFP